MFMFLVKKSYVGVNWLRHRRPSARPSIILILTIDNNVTTYFKPLVASAGFNFIVTVAITLCFDPPANRSSDNVAS